MKFLEELAARRRFGMKPGLDTIRALCSILGEPQRRFRAIHVAGTNGKGAVVATLAAALNCPRYTSPHLVKLNERFVIGGSPVDDATLERIAARVDAAISASGIGDVTFFEALTAVAFELFAEAGCERAVLECGLGGRLDATNVCEPELCVITRIGLDHCDWLGDTVEKIAAEKAGIIKAGVPVVLGRNEPEAVEVIRRRAEELGAPFHYAPDLADESEIPPSFPLKGGFNRENAVTALAALRCIDRSLALPDSAAALSWPGRFQRIGTYLVDGAHNPPAAKALAEALAAESLGGLDLIAGFCGDKDSLAVLRSLAPFVRRGYAVRTVNPRSLSAEDTAARMREAGIAAAACESLSAALAATAASPSTLICGSLFLVGEALVALGVCECTGEKIDDSESLRPCSTTVRGRFVV